MTLHETTFSYLKPSDKQVETMADVRERFYVLAQALQASLPDGADKTHVIRLVRTAAMWANVAITRQQDGSPRD